MNVWEIGSRWDNIGKKGNSVFNIFIKYNIVFAGNDEKREKTKK